MNLTEENANNKEREWREVLDAVRAFVSTEEVCLPNLSHDLCSFSPLTTNARDNTFDEGYNEELLETLRDNNNQLNLALRLLKSDFPRTLHELLIIAEEEHAMRERVETELSVVRNKWKTEVDSMRDIIHQNNATIAHLTKLYFPPQDASEVYQRKLAEAEAEIQILRKHIESRT